MFTAWYNISSISAIKYQLQLLNNFKAGVRSAKPRIYHDKIALDWQQKPYIIEPVSFVVDAVVISEPAPLLLFGLGGMVLRRKR